MNTLLTLEAGFIEKLSMSFNSTNILGRYCGLLYLKEFSISLGRDLSKQHVLNLCYCGLTGTEHLNMTMSEKYTYNCYKHNQKQKSYLRFNFLIVLLIIQFSNENTPTKR
jgi:hypothetical protein